MPATLSFRASDESVESLDKLCQATERDRTYHLTRAVSRYLETEMWHVSAVHEGIADAEAGNLTPLEDVKKHWQEKRDARLDPKS